MSPRIRLVSLAASAVLGLSVLAAAPASATEGAAPAACTLSSTGVKAAQDELALIRAQIKGVRPSKTERRAVLEAIRALESAARGAESRQSRKRKGDARRELTAKLRAERDAELRVVLRAQLKALNEALEPGRMSQAEKHALRAKRAELVALLTGKPSREVRKALQQRKRELNRLLEPCLAVVPPPAEEPVAQEPVAEQPAP